MNESLGTPVGYLNPLLYQSAHTEAGFHDITSGNNGAYTAKRGWDTCTGLGTPIGTQIIGVLTGSDTGRIEQKKTGT
jgi:kumamolisin